MKCLVKEAEEKCMCEDCKENRRMIQSMVQSYIAIEVSKIVINHPLGDKK
jgi:hypothetical protein